MPRLPEYVPREGVPTTSGVGRGAVPVPVVGTPTADVQAQTAGIRAVGAVAQSLVESGGALMQAEEFRSRRQQAQGVLDAKTKLQTGFRQPMQTVYEELRQGDYREFPDALLREGNRLIQEAGADLPPEARRYFTEDAQQLLSVMQQQAIGERTRRRDQDTAFAMQREVQDFQTTLLRTQDPFERIVARSQLEGTLQRFVETGLVDGTKAADVLQKTLDAVQVQDVQIKIQASPAEMLGELLAQARGEETLSGLPVPPREQLAPLIQEAQRTLTQNVQFREGRDAAVKRQLQEQQKRQASEFRIELYRPGMTLPDILGLVPKINEARRNQQLSEEDHTSLLKDAETLATKLRDDPYKDRDVPTVHQDLSFQIETADTPAQLDAASEAVRAQAASLSSGSVQAFLARIDARRNQQAYTNRDPYKEGRQLILGAAFPGGIVQATMEALNPATRIKLSTALDIYAETMQTVYEEQGQRAGDGQAREKARALKELYFPKDETTPENLPGLPSDLQGLPYHEALLKLDGMRIAPTLKRQLFLRLRQMFPTPANEMPLGATPAGPYTIKAGPPTQRGETPK